MAEKGEKRDPTSHRTPTQQKRHTREYNGRPDQIARRSAQNKARRQLEKEGLVRKGDGKHVDHKRPLDKGGTNARSNLRVVSAKQNLSHGMENQHTLRKKGRR
jgi:hypothetical protein